jgi:hypothetical protein
LKVSNSAIFLRSLCNSSVSRSFDFSFILDTPQSFASLLSSIFIYPEELEMIYFLDFFTIQNLKNQRNLHNPPFG